MHTRQNALNKWLNDVLGHPFSLSPLAGDASFRQYFRLQHQNHSYVVMDAPPEKESVSSFIHIATLLAQHDIDIPHIHASDQAQGFILMEDLGDLLLLKAVNSDNLEKLYHQALTTLAKIQSCPTEALPVFNQTIMLEELHLCQSWFLQHFLQLKLTSKEREIVQMTFAWLAGQIMAQPQVFVHRDYHSRNLMVIDNGEHPVLGVIDFQDAVLGPCAYDLVSLLKDCYIQLPREKIDLLLSAFYDKMAHPCLSFDAFKEAFDLCGLQRHLKVLGIFSRLHLRDQKPDYLKDLPLTFSYILNCLEQHPESRSFDRFMRYKVYDELMEKSL